MECPYTVHTRVRAGCGTVRYFRETGMISVRSAGSDVAPADLFAALVAAPEDGDGVVEIVVVDAKRLDLDARLRFPAGRAGRVVIGGRPGSS